MDEKTCTCTDCKKQIHESEPLAMWNNNEHFCLDCALKRGIIGPLYWLSMSGFDIYHHAEYHDGKITAYQKWGRGYRKDELELLR